jgi:2-haloacid dehalogenase
MARPTLPGVKACVFDAYGTLFDVNSAAAACREQLGAKWQAFSDTWRQKQLSYTWLRSLMRRYVDFRQVTADALDFSLASHGVDDEALRRRLLDLYDALEPYPEVRDVLARLRQAGMRSAILSNGSPAMLASAVAHAGLGGLLDAVYSVDAIGVFKPDPRVYALASEGLGLSPAEICFQSSNAWDAHAAKVFGFRVVWCNRGRQAPERLPGPPDIEVADLSSLPALVGASR